MKHRLRVFLVVLLLAVCLLPIWYSLGDHSLYGGSEGRYASVSRAMVESGDWLLPRFGGEIHLTKPPLTYWLEAGAMRWLGCNELAVRLPSAVAGSLTVLGVFVVGWRVRDWRVGLVAAALLSMMPLFIAIHRLTLTDGPLGLFWLGVWAGGYFAVTETSRRARWAAAGVLWVSVALGLMTKGPVIWLALALVVGWVMAGRGWRELAKLHLPAGLVLSALPLGWWVWRIVGSYPQAMDVWYHEVVSRAVGDGDHVRPTWYFAPIFLGGLFPATVMMGLPGVHHRVREAWQHVRRGSPQALWMMSVVVPLVVFSLNRGKLASYVLPLCPPMALLTAAMLSRWLSGFYDRGDADRVRAPEVVWALLILLVLVVGAGVVARWWWLGSGGTWVLAAGAVLVMCAGQLCWIWKRRPGWRGAGLVLVFAAYMGVVCMAEELEDDLLAAGSTKRFLAEVMGDGYGAEAQLVTYGFTDTSLAFYYRHCPQANTPAQLRQWLRKAGDRLIVLADPKDWQQLLERSAPLVKHFEVISDSGHRFLHVGRVVLRPRARGEFGGAMKRSADAGDELTGLTVPAGP
jgi:4-amino-4-deoxy-L-arabinose transferase-like glycosyltransferase